MHFVDVAPNPPRAPARRAAPRGIRAAQLLLCALLSLSAQAASQSAAAAEYRHCLGPPEACSGKLRLGVRHIAGREPGDPAFTKIGDVIVSKGRAAFELDATIDAGTERFLGVSEHPWSWLELANGGGLVGTEFGPCDLALSLWQWYANTLHASCVGSTEGGAPFRRTLHALRDGEWSLVREEGDSFPSLEDPIEYFKNLDDPLSGMDGPALIKAHDHNGHEAVFASDGNSLELVFNPWWDLNLLPQEQFEIVDGVANGGSFAFRGDFVIQGESGSAIVLVDDEGVHLVAHTGTKLPGEDRTFDAFGSGLDVHGSTVAFSATSAATATHPEERSGVYVASVGSVEVVYDDTTLDPTTGEPFGLVETSHSVWQLVDERTVIFAVGIGTLGIHQWDRWDDGKIYRLISQADVEDFPILSFNAATEEMIVFQVWNSVRAAVEVHALMAGQFVRIVGTGDIRQGGPIENLQWPRRRHADGHHLAFIARYEDDSEALFLATVPEPGMALGAGVALVMLCALRGGGRWVCGRFDP